MSKASLHVSVNAELDKQGRHVLCKVCGGLVRKIRLLKHVRFEHPLQFQNYIWGKGFGFSVKTKHPAHKPGPGFQSLSKH